MFILVSGASGSGKSSIIDAVLKKYDGQIAILPSSTTRPIRPGEVEGRNYYYLSHEEFQNKIDEGDFIEYQKVFENGNYYGVSRSRFEEFSKKYPMLIKDVDIYGVQAIKNDGGIDCVTIYIDVPDNEVVRQRLIARGDSLEDIEIRIARKNFEDSFKPKYDYVVENHNLAKAIKEICKIVDKELKKRQKS
ncbi:MAG: guanylate kinase [Clostridia bacterium]|nr:guanylate kinase [Clostridia bacterium]